MEAGLIDQISPKAQKAIESCNLLVSPIVLLELEMLHEIGRSKYGASKVVSGLSQRVGLQICQLPMAAVVMSSLGIKWTREPADRLIVANAIANNNAPLLTSDRSIHEHYANAIW
jgi:PIN domain nuclease of toxin-antitoxin system